MRKHILTLILAMLVVGCSPMVELTSRPQGAEIYAGKDHTDLKYLCSSTPCRVTKSEIKNKGRYVIGKIDGIGAVDHRFEDEITPVIFDFKIPYLNDHPELPAEIKRAIKEGKIFVGMTKEQLLISWGPPREVNDSVGVWGKHEQWIYGGYYGGGQYVYLENGIVTSWQNG